MRVPPFAVLLVRIIFFLFERPNRMSVGNYDSDSDDDLSTYQVPPIGENDVKLVHSFKVSVQKTKDYIYEKSVRQTGDSENLDSLHKYEIALYTVGTELLKTLYGFKLKSTSEYTPKELVQLMNDPTLSTDARILLENEVRNQFIQYPYTRKSNMNTI